MRFPASRNSSAFDSKLFAPHRARRWNCGLTLYIRVYLRKVNPAGDAATGTSADWDTRHGTPQGPRRRITRWPGGAFELWCARYQRECQAFWDGNFWLSPPNTFTAMDFRNGSQRLRPAVRCGFRLILVQRARSAHHAIDCVHLAADEPHYRSDSAHYDHRDMDPAPTGGGMTQRTHFHEVGHLLGLGHQSSGAATCVNNNPVCYAGGNIMGQGEGIAASNATPWRSAIRRMTGVAESSWTVSLSETPPRQLP